MLNTKDCDTCGNGIPDASMLCPFCGSHQRPGRPAGRRDRLRSVNIEADRPTVVEGLARLEQELARARQSGARVVRVIHGWGSTGKGGKLRDACRAFLNRELKARQIQMVVPGDGYAGTTTLGRGLMSRCPDLRKGERTDSRNPGITFVEL